MGSKSAESQNSQLVVVRCPSLDRKRVFFSNYFLIIDSFWFGNELNCTRVKRSPSVPHGHSRWPSDSSPELKISASSVWTRSSIVTDLEIIVLGEELYDSL